MIIVIISTLILSFILTFIVHMLFSYIKFKNDDCVTVECNKLFNFVIERYNIASSLVVFIIVFIIMLHLRYALCLINIVI